MRSFALGFLAGLIIFGSVAVIITALRATRRVALPLIFFIGYRFYAFGFYWFRPSIKVLMARHHGRA